MIKCWDIAFAQMKKGQSALITCPPDIAYGPNGAGNVIPPNTTLQFQVELISIDIEPVSRIYQQ